MKMKASRNASRPGVSIRRAIRSGPIFALQHDSALHDPLTVPHHITLNTNDDRDPCHN